MTAGSEREAFEADAAAHGFRNFTRAGDGYYEMRVHHRWLGYRAGRAHSVGEAQRAEFENLVRPLIAWLNRTGHPHMRIIITTTGAELVEGVAAMHTEEYLR